LGFYLINNWLENNQLGVLLVIGVPYIYTAKLSGSVNTTHDGADL